MCFFYLFSDHFPSKSAISLLWKRWLLLSRQHGSLNGWFPVQTLKLIWNKTILDTGEMFHDDALTCWGSQLFPLLLSSISLKPINKAVWNDACRWSYLACKESKDLLTSNQKIHISSLYLVRRGILWCASAHMCVTVVSAVVKEN